MTDKISYKLYTAKDIKKILGINANTLYHWVLTRRLLKPKIQGRGKGSENKFSIDNLATLLLIKILKGFGLELRAIEYLLRILLAPGPSKQEKGLIGIIKGIRKRKLNVWNHYRSNKDVFNKEGLFLFWTMPKSGRIQEGFSSFQDMDGTKYLLNFMAAKDFSENITVAKDIDIIGANIVNITGIVKEIEEKTGETF